MPDLGPHAAFIWSAYAVVALVIALLAGWIVVDGRRQRALLEQLESKSKAAGGRDQSP